MKRTFSDTVRINMKLVEKRPTLSYKHIPVSQRGDTVYILRMRSLITWLAGPGLVRLYRRVIG